MSENENFLRAYNRLECIIKKKYDVPDSESPVKLWEDMVSDAKTSSTVRTARELRNTLAHSVTVPFTVDESLTEFLNEQSYYAENGGIELGSVGFKKSGDNFAVPVLSTFEKAAYRRFDSTASREERNAVINLSAEISSWSAARKRKYLEANGLSDVKTDWNYTLAVCEYVRKTREEKTELQNKYAPVDVEAPPFFMDVTSETNKLDMEEKHFTLSLEIESDGVATVGKKAFTTFCELPVTLKFAITSLSERGYSITLFCEDVARGVAVREKKEYALEAGAQISERLTLSVPLCLDNGSSTLFYGASVSLKGGMLNKTYKKSAVKTIALIR